MSTSHGDPTGGIDLQAALDLALAFEHASMGLLLLRDESGSMRVAASLHVPTSLWPDFERDSKAGMIHAACLEHRRLCIFDSGATGLDEHLRQLARTLHFRGFSMQPIARNGDTIGAFVSLFRWPRRPSNRAARMVRPFCELVAMALDTTRKFVAAREALGAAESLARERLRFLATMSHEMRTPLQSIMGHLDMLRLGIPETPTPRQLEAFDRIQHAERILLSVIEDLGTFARLDAGAMEFVVMPAPVQSLVDAAVAVVEPIARQAGVSVHTAPAPADTLVLADRVKITQLLVNLVTNAVKFTGRGDHVRVRCTVVAWGVRIDVIDHGPGIPPDHLETVFNEYVQLGRRVPEGLRGLGLGLAISRRYAEAMGGSLTVTSTPGHGATFSLILPEPARSKRATVRPPARSPARASRTTTLAQTSGLPARSAPP